MYVIFGNDVIVRGASPRWWINLEVPVSRLSTCLSKTNRTNNKPETDLPIISRHDCVSHRRRHAYNTRTRVDRDLMNARPYGARIICIIIIIRIICKTMSLNNTVTVRQRLSFVNDPGWSRSIEIEVAATGTNERQRFFNRSVRHTAAPRIIVITGGRVITIRYDNTFIHRFHCWNVNA